jgi:CheY-like chemotaxis protein
MSNWNLEPDSGSFELPGGIDVGNHGAANLAAVLVIGKSNITRVVVSKIVERSGLRPVSESPEDGKRALSSVMPGTVILDGGADNCDCNHLYAYLSDQRRASGGNVPRVILLSTRTGTPDTLSLGPVVDAVVAKPITPENLQPVVDRLLETVRRSA